MKLYCVTDVTFFIKEGISKLTVSKSTTNTFNKIAF